MVESISMTCPVLTVGETALIASREGKGLRPLSSMVPILVSDQRVTELTISNGGKGLHGPHNTARLHWLGTPGKAKSSGH